MKNVDAAGSNRPGPGGYVVRIENVTNRQEKQYIEVEFEIIEGEFAGYYGDLFKRRSFWGGKFRRSYKEKAMPFFKSFIQTVQDCNNGAPGLVVGDFEDIDETKLPGCVLGIVFGFEEYIGNDGTVKQRPDFYNAIFMQPDKVRAGQYKVPDLKLLDGVPATGSARAVTSAGVVDTTLPQGFVADDDDTPF